MSMTRTLHKSTADKSSLFMSEMASDVTAPTAKVKHLPKDLATAGPTKSKAGLAKKSSPMDLMKPMLSIVGSEFVSFWYIHYGGTNNLLPGRPEELRFALNIPDGAQVFPAITKINFGYINGNDDNPPMNLNEHPLGQLGVDCWVDGNELVCWMRLSTNDQTIPCTGEVNVNVLYFN